MPFTETPLRSKTDTGEYGSGEGQVWQLAQDQIQRLSQENKAENDTAELMVSYSRLFMYALGHVYPSTHLPGTCTHTDTDTRTHISKDNHLFH